MENIVKDCDGKTDFLTEKTVCGIYRAIKSKSISIYLDNERVGVGLYPFILDMNNGENANVQYMFEGHRVVVYAGRDLLEGEELTVGLTGM